MYVFRNLLFFSICLTTLSVLGCAQSDVETRSTCELVLDCAYERCVTDPSLPADQTCAQQCYCDQVCDLDSPSCNRACMSAEAATFTPLTDFLSLTSCMASKNCGDQGCAGTQCGFAYQTCRLSDINTGNTNTGEGTTNDSIPGREHTGEGSSSQLNEVTTEDNRGEGETNEGGTGETNTNTGDGTNTDGTTTPPSTTDSFVGKACANDSDCGVAGAVCLDLPGGYCTMNACANTSGVCPEGSKCYSFQGDESYCLDSCADASDCRVAEGYTCDSYNTCWPKGSTGGNSPVGGPCATNSDCADEGAQCYPEFSQGSPTGFINGYCLIPDCSQGSCPSGATCEAIFQGGGTACLSECAQVGDCRNTEGYTCMSGTDGGMCFRGCGDGATCPAGYACDAQAQYCVPACTDEFCGPDKVCADNGLCEDPPCTAGSCTDGLICSDSGVCVPDITGGPGAGPGPLCDNLPSPTCMDTPAKCSEVIPFEPNEGPGYVDYPINGEVPSNEYRSYARRDLVMLVKWATAYVDCKSQGWTGGNGYPLGLGDMSESDGSIPGTAINQPGHPPGTHVNGHDIDIAYYQNTITGQPNNYLRPICDHVVGGADQHHCVSEPYMLDLWRTALFIGALFSSPRTRVIGVDGKAGAMISQALAVLCADGWIPAAGCLAQNQSLACEVEDDNGGLCWKENGALWFYHHHHHMHLSIYGLGNGFTNSNLCLTPDCSPVDYSMEHLEDQEIMGHVRSKEFLPQSFLPFDQPL